MSRAESALAAVEHCIPPDLRQGLEILLSQCADPQSAVRRLETFCQQHSGEFQAIAYSPFGLQALVAVFSYSGFLSEELQQHPDWLVSLLESGSLPRPISREELEVELAAAVAKPGSESLALQYARFRRRSILRILLRDILGFAALSETTEELSLLADVLLHGALASIRSTLSLRYGDPTLETGGACGFSVLALGKLGGRELNYSSDIDLMFVYQGAGSTNGPSPLSNKEFYKKVSNQLTELLGTYTAQGICYRVDLRLRPDGRLGEICHSLEAMQSYYSQRARDWELQMLIKARVAAGEPDPGRAFLEWVQPKIYSSSLNFTAIEEMSETRVRISEKLNGRKRPASMDVKLAPGGIRDIEFLVQCLQRVHGGRDAWVRNSSTQLALIRLRDKDLLADSEYSRLASAYQFLRHLEHRLQFAEDRQTHTLPESRDELALIARRMPQTSLGDNATPEVLLEILKRHLDRVQEVYERLVHAQQPMYYQPQAVVPMEAESTPADAVELPEFAASNLIRFLDQKAPGLAAAVARARLGRQQATFEHFLEIVLRNEEWLKTLDADPVLCGYLVEIFQNSPYLADQLVRHSEYFEEIRAIRDRGPSSTRYVDVMPLLEEAVEIRRYFLQQMFRILAESICLQTSVFTTLERTSELADAAIVSCYRLAVLQTMASMRPLRFSGALPERMTVIGLGRLGMSEFDLGSDADLVFAIPDEDLPDLPFWTRVAERLVAILGSYTGDGVMFAVDTRLCPNGRAGALVQSMSAYCDYFARQAEAWEGMAYMKSRAVAGNLEQGTKLLADLQKIDWRRYGQSGRSRRELHQMRLRIEKEHGKSNVLKSGPGGYYDIDFALLYLRLKGAGMFFKVLNTPLRIEVIEQMGHLDSADANFLRDAATFYRAVDHGLRLISGHSEGSLPTAESQLRMLTRLAGRWLPDHLHDQPLPFELRQIQERTRDFFERLFTD